ncbi:MAG TPA: penicillin-binding protein 2 [Stellaceae bacterium]|nr:penicillin-binding protein 2 [Stellaceae bacterium]
MKPAVPPRDDNPCRPRHFKPEPCAPAPLEGPAKQSLETSHTRLLITGALLCLAFLVISARLIEVAGFKAGEAHIARVAPAERPDLARANIVDRNGVLLATTLEAPSLYADPKLIHNPERVAQQLASLLPDVSESEIAAKLASNKGFVWIKRQLTPSQEFEVNRLGVPGLEFRTEGRRVYPKGNLTVHAVGYDDLDGKGLAGIERGFNDILRGRHEPVELSLDVRLQYILHHQIAQTIADFNAIGGMGIIMDVNTGEVLAMVSLPDFDPNAPGSATPQELFNRVTLGTYEMGSTFKIFNTALALETHTSTLSSSYDATKPLHIGRFTIHDDEPKNRWLTVPEIFEYSSNIGSARMAVAVGTDRQKEFLGRLGLLKAPSFELREIGAPIVPSPWGEINTMTIAFGHGISVSPLQMATAVSAVVNGGVLHRATLIKRPAGYAPSGQQVLSLKTSEEMRALLRLVVEHGTGKFADAPGYLVGGKTGTAEKVSAGRYERHGLLSSFVGVFPINEPRYLVMISIDEPHGNKQSHGFATGGWTAAPAVARVVERMAPLMGIQPVDEDSPEIRRSLVVDSQGPQGRKFAAD